MTRVQDKIHTCVEEDHHLVLDHIFRMAGRNKIPLSGNCLVHLDSHPDLLLPQNITHQQMTDRQVLNEKLSIESWILPGVYWGLIDIIVWICPPWSNQIQEGRHDFKIGRRIEDGSIRYIFWQ